MPEEQDVNILAEDLDMADELEENVGVPPRKVTMEEYEGAEDAFSRLVELEEEEFETMPFRPGKSKVCAEQRTERRYSVLYR